MELINYTLTSIVSFLGLILGIILAYIAKEELKQGKKYFIFLQKVILTLIFFFIFYYLKLNIFFIIILSLIFFILIYLYNEKIKTYYIYPFLAILFYFSSKNVELFKIQAFLIFLYGFPTGSLLTKVKKRNYLEIFIKHISFIIISLILFLIF